MVGSKNKEISRYIFRVTLLLFNAIAIFQFVLILTGVSMSTQMGRLMAFLIGLFMIFVGNISPKIKETNKHFGFRVPWIMSNDEAFRKTQRFFGFASTISGVIFILISLFVANQLAMIFVSIVLLLTIGITVVYSYKISK